MSVKHSIILGIESSCDDTSAAILLGNKIVSNCIANQKIHQKYGGVVPELASRAHQENIVPVVKEALSIANISIKEIDAIEAKSYGQKECLEAGIQFARTEGIMPAPEATHAIKGAVDEALKCKAEGKSKSILFNLCGHGHFDMQAYMDYFSGELAEDSFDAKAFEESLSAIPAVN